MSFIMNDEHRYIPVGEEALHNHLLELDRKYGTPLNSPLHHDNRWCGFCGGYGIQRKAK